MAEGDCGAGALSVALTNELMAGVDYTIPTPDLSGSDFLIPDENPNDPIFGSISRLTNADLTDKTIGGTGTFDVLMDAFKAHLIKEYESGRITGEQYSKAYIELTTAAMGNAVQFLLARDQSFWTAVQAQQQARLVQLQVITARIGLETSKVQLSLLQFQALTAQSEYALSKIKLAGESVNYCIAKYNLSDMLPTQKAQVLAQVELVTAQVVNIETETLGVIEKTLLTQQQVAQSAEETRKVQEEADTILAQRTNLLPVQILQTEAQTANLVAQSAYTTVQTTELVPAQVAQNLAQIALVEEQKEAARAQTSNSRSDGIPVAGMLGKQKDLYDQQITSYKRDAEVKAAKMFVDAWITQKTLDEGLVAPTAFTNASLDTVMSSVKANNNL